MKIYFILLTLCCCILSLYPKEHFCNKTSKDVFVELTFSTDPRQAEVIHGKSCLDIDKSCITSVRMVYGPDARLIKTPNGKGRQAVDGKQFFKEKFTKCPDHRFEIIQEGGELKVEWYAHKPKKPVF